MKGRPLIFIFLFLICIHPVSAELVFSDNFNDGTFAGDWNVLTGSWSLETTSGLDSYYLDPVPVSASIEPDITTAEFKSLNRWEFDVARSGGMNFYFLDGTTDYYFRAWNGQDAQSNIPGYSDVEDWIDPTNTWGHVEIIESNNNIVIKLYDWVTYPTSKTLMNSQTVSKPGDVESTFYITTSSAFNKIDNVELYGGSSAEGVTGTIIFDSVVYSYPDSIDLTVELSDHDFEYCVYYFDLEESYDGVSFYLNHAGPGVSTSPESFTIDYIGTNSLPQYMRLVLYQYDLTTGAETVLDYSDTKIYNPQGSSGVVSWNQSIYTDPESVGVIYDIQNYDNSSFEYWVEILGTNNDGIWIGVNSEYIELETSSGQVNFTIDSQWLNLPMTIKGVLWSYDKNIGLSSILAETREIAYNPASIAPGLIWTDKESYNVTELVEISYTTNVTDNYIAVEEPYSIWSTHNVPVGTYSFLYELSTSAVGNTDIYLFENGELVDQVTISVSSESGDDAYAAWMKVNYYTGEIANFYYYSSNTSAQITVYDGADVVVFGPATTQLGYHNGMVNTANTNPGTFLVSLYHNGTYYNDTMILESVDSWVRFDSSKYYVGDTINIEYYLSDPTQQISMWDANQKKVVRFTTNYGLVSGSMQTLPYTLSEYNEYSHDIPGRLASGELTLGFWKIFIEDKNGVIVGDSWDETYVCEVTDDDGSYGFDTSNDMISIFFSPEGIFLLFTAALTMMGLVAAKHPAGGGAGAVVGVGFGVYFKVLPPWMLFLMVITLVVLAGVSVAVHFKGK